MALCMSHMCHDDACQVVIYEMAPYRISEMLDYSVCLWWDQQSSSFLCSAVLFLNSILDTISIAILAYIVVPKLFCLALDASLAF